MSVICGVCRLTCVDPSKVSKCAGNCGGAIHLECVPVKTRNAKKDWLCENCKPDTVKSASSASSKSVTVTELSKEFLISTVDSLKREIMGEIKKVISENSEIRNSLQFMSDSMDKTNSLMDTIKSQLKRYEEENQQLRRDNTELRKSVSTLEERLRNLEQHSRRQNIEIDGVPETSGESVVRILQDVAGAIGVEFKEEAVVAAHRVPSFNKKKTKPIVVRFSNYEERDKWIAGFRQVRPLAASAVNASFSGSSKIFINEHLTPENKLFLSKVKEAARNKSYKYVWCRNGKVFIRKNESEKCIRVEHLSDIDKLQ
jgi:regulator of replication initiation timing